MTRRIEKYEDIKWENDVSEPLTSTECRRAIGLEPGVYYTQECKAERDGVSYAIERQKAGEQVRSRSSAGWKLKWQFVLCRDGLPSTNATRDDDITVDHPDAYVAAVENAQPTPARLLPKVIARSKYDEDIKARDEQIERLRASLGKASRRADLAERDLHVAQNKVTRIKPRAIDLHPDVANGLNIARRIEGELQELAQEIVTGAKGLTVEQIVMEVEHKRKQLDACRVELATALLEVTKPGAPMTSEERVREQAVMMRNDGKSLLEICRLLNRKHNADYKPEHIKAMLEEVA